jgi:hypothetical protein
MPVFGVSCLALALLGGALIGYVELHTTEVTPTVALIVLIGVLLGFGSRRYFWLCGVIVGASVPLAYVAAALFGITPVERPQPAGELTYVEVGAFTIAVAVIASASGAAIARFASSDG